MWVAEQVAALVERIEPARLPGAEEAGEGQARPAAGRAARAAADLAGDDERAQRPGGLRLGEVVVGAAARGADELEELAVVAQEPVRQRAAGMGGPGGAAPPERVLRPR